MLHASVGYIMVVSYMTAVTEHGPRDVKQATDTCDVVQVQVQFIVLFNCSIYINSNV
jgi:hypothetical protein